jgi:3-keto-disaccharide hydrolase
MIFRSHRNCSSQGEDSMKRISFVTTALLSVVLALAGCGTPPTGSGWVALIDGDKGLENFNRIGDANWRAEGGAIVADKGKGGYLVSKNAYKDFEIYAEFWAATDTNSGVFLRAGDPGKIGADSAYEVNIWDIRPDPSYGTGGIVNVARVPVPIVYKAGGQWNTYEIYANGTQLTVKFNGVVTVSTQDGKHANGPIALQFGAGLKDAVGGPIKWRRVMIKPL